MQAQDLIRAAAKLIEEAGWSQGAAVRNRAGEVIPLWRGDNTGTDRVRVNPDAASYSIYGAIVKAAVLHGGSADLVLWGVLDELARTEMRAPGGTNHVHKVIGYNDRPGRTKEEVLAFMERAAAAAEPSTLARQAGIEA